MDLKVIVEAAITSLTNNCSIETIMLKAQTIAYTLKDESFTKWVHCEQNGYSNNDTLPSYRIIPCQVHTDVSLPFGRMVKNYSFPPGMLSEYDDLLFHMRFRNSITEIERFSTSNEMLKTEVIAAMYSKMNECIDGNILNARQVISAANLTSIITIVKSKLLDFFLQLNDKLDMKLDLTKLENKQTVSNIMNQTIYAGVVNTGSGSIEVKNSNVVGGENNTLIINDEVKQQITDLLEKIKAINVDNVDEKQDVDESIATIQSELNKDDANPRIIRRALRAIKSVPAVMGAHVIELGMDKILSMLGAL